MGCWVWLGLNFLIIALVSKIWLEILYLIESVHLDFWSVSPKKFVKWLLYLHLSYVYLLICIRAQFTICSFHRDWYLIFLTFFVWNLGESFWLIFWFTAWIGCYIQGLVLTIILLWSLLEMSQKGLIYSFVAKGTVVLAEHTSYTGNFSTIAVQCLQKLPSNSSKYTYSCDGHTFNFLLDNGFGIHYF